MSLIQKYRPEIDGLRAVAVISVMGFHFDRSFFSGGSLGVDIFFVISGFLITSIISNEFYETHYFNYVAFILKRIRRLIPALSFLILFYWTFCPILWPSFSGRRTPDAVVTALYLTNIRQIYIPSENPLSHTWSLSIEEQYYVVWPWILLFLLRFSRQTAATILLIAWTTLTIVRPVWAHFIGGQWAYYFTPLHATGLVIGSALALKPIKIRAGAAAFLTLLGTLLWGHTEIFGLYEIPIAEILTIFIISETPKLLSARPLRIVGRASYGIYLWHIPIAWAWTLPLPLGFMTLPLISIGAGIISHWGVERWFLSRKDKLPTDRDAISGVSEHEPSKLGTQQKA